MNLPPSPHDPTTRTIRPWGNFDLYLTNKRCTIKIISVQPGHRLSLQRHRHRDETWHVLDGRLDIVNGTHAWTADPGECVWIPRGTTHRMGNSGSTPTRVLEIASGHFDEDDIERLDDDYDRHQPLEGPG